MEMESQEVEMDRVIALDFYSGRLENFAAHKPADAISRSCPILVPFHMGIKGR